MASSAPAPASTLPCSEAHDAQAQLPHVVIFPFMAKSHTIPLADLAHLLRRRQMATVTFVTTPGNAAFVRAALAGADSVAIVELPFADNLTKPGAPPLPECVESLDLMSSFPAFVESVSLLRPRFEKTLAALRPPASAVVADAFLYWAHEAAGARGVPTLAFFGTSVFAHVTREVLLRDNPASVLTRGTPDAVFTVPEFPDVQLALADLAFPFNDPATTGPTREMDAKIGHAIASSHGLIVNTFDAMEGPGATSSTGTGTSGRGPGPSARSASPGRPIRRRGMATWPSLVGCGGSTRRPLMAVPSSTSRLARRWPSRALS
jgi:hypothetical protein